MRLSPREEELLEVIRNGARTYDQIALALEPIVSPHTAEAHVRRVAEKLRELPDFEHGTPLLIVTLHALTTARDV